jgi:DHA2 family multidrug resistance protein
VQGYNAMQIGQVIMWMGMPQPFIMPLMPVLMKRMDSRLMCSIGVVLFASGVIAKAWMTHDSAIDQLKFAQLGMAFGMPMLMTPLMGIGTGTIEPANAANASVLWNMLRNLGGSVGIALLGTMVTVREHFHSAMIGESVSLYSTPALEQLNTMTQGFIASGYDAVTAQQQALGAMANLVRREAYVMAYNDAFFVIGSLLFLTGSLVWLTKPGKPAGGPSAAH